MIFLFSSLPAKRTVILLNVQSSILPPFHNKTLQLASLVFSHSRVQPIKHAPNLLDPQPSLHRHLQQNPRFLRVQPPARHHPVLDILSRHEAVDGPPARHHGHARLVPRLQRGGLDPIVDAAGAAASEDEALGAGVDGGGDEGGQVVLVRVDDGDRGEGRGGRGRGREEGLVGDGGGGVVEVGDLVDEEAELALLGGVEGVETVGVVFGRVEGGADATVFC